MKIIKNTFSLLLIACLLITLFAGCANDAKENVTYSPSPSPVVSPSPSPPATETATYDYDAAKTFLPGDTVILIINGSPVYWDEFYHWLAVCVQSILQETGLNAIEDWNAVYQNQVFDEEKSYSDFVISYAEDAVTMYRAIETQFDQLGLTVNEDDVITKESIMSYLRLDEAGFADYLKQGNWTEELFQYINLVSAKYYALFTHFYGDQGADIPDDEVAAYVESNGFVQAKHILISNTKEDGTAYSEEEMAERRKTAEDIVAQLRTYNGDNLEGFFDELMNQYTGDTGSASYPDGYVYRPGTMIPEFEEAAAALPEYGVSDVVEGKYGYHIILRVPINYDGVPLDQKETGYTLRYLTAVDRFKSIVADWRKELQVQHEDVYNTIKPVEIFVAS